MNSKALLKRDTRTDLQALSDHLHDGLDMAGIAPDVDIADSSQGMPMHAQFPRLDTGHDDGQLMGGWIGPQRLKQCQPTHGRYRRIKNDEARLSAFDEGQKLSPIGNERYPVAYLAQRGGKQFVTLARWGDEQNEAPGLVGENGCDAL